MTETPVGHVPFQANVELLRLFLTHREDIVESIEAVLNAQRKLIRYLQDQSLLSRHFEDCFFARPGVTASQARVQTHLRGQLEEAHWAAGFRPRPVRDLHNDLIHPAEMMIRGFYCWQQTRWPGRNGRMHYAHTLFNLYVLRWLQFLSMRLWDEDLSSEEGPGSAGARLAEIQGVLDELWRSSPAGQPVIVRDARWLIPLAQSLITDELAPYFEVARQVTETLPEADVLEIQKAHVRMLGGHLTSQIRYYCTKDGLTINERSVVLRTRASNALDFALLVQGLVDLLKAYDRALQSGDERMRLDMAGAICQGISADRELFLNRIDLLSAYSMIEHVFIGTDPGGHVGYLPAGQRHVQLLKEYRVLIDRLIRPLRDDFPRFRPVDGGFSPYGVIFGLPSHLIEHMALKAIEHDAETRFSLEDLFDDGDEDGNTKAAKLAWVNGWRKLPHIDRDAQRLYEYPQQFAEEVYARIESELAGKECDSSRTGRLYIVSGDDPEVDLKETDAKASAIPELPARYFVSSDRQIVSAHKADPYDRAQLLAGRREGHFLVSYEVSYEAPGGWIALRKDLLTEVLGAGRDARIVGLPRDAAQVLRLMCTDLVLPENVADQASEPPSIEEPDL
ncbi:MAG: hypothetical protein LAP61_12060 [Acidobacteriia bacterium]|nr:hypothetical protein [Terriglobia bacterium]